MVLGAKIYTNEAFNGTVPFCIEQNSIFPLFALDLFYLAIQETNTTEYFKVNIRSEMSDVKSCYYQQGRKNKGDYFLEYIIN